MSESVKPRFAVDLNEIERHLSQAQAAPSQPASTGRADPLAELARIVGQEDPFQSLLASEASARRGQTGGDLDNLFAVRDEAAPVARAAAQPQARQPGFDLPAFDLDSYPQAPARAAEPTYAYQAAAPSRGHDAYDAGAHGQHYYDDAPQADTGYDQADPMDYEPAPKRSRKGLIALGAILGCAVIGGGGAYFMSGKAGVASGGQPPLIKATAEPVKVPPQNPGGVEIPNQNKQIYERANTNTETKVVSREEQPVDVKQVARMNSGGTTDATASTSLNLGEPRKVRTVSIRPDGSLAKAEAPASGNGNAAARPVAMPAPMTLPAAAQPTPPAPVAAVQPKPATSTPVAAPSTPAAKPVTTAATPAPAATPQKVASAQPMAPVPSATVADTTGMGGYSVQLAVRGSEGEAQTAFQQLQKKYDDLDGVPSMIRKAEVNGNTVYRVRVGPMSREEASSLCSKLQGQGGQCFVAKN